jgi:hypothetical protein
MCRASKLPKGSYSPSSPPLAEDALDPGCQRCGVAGVMHRSPGDCIDTLRDLIAELTEDPLLARKVKAGTNRGRVHPRAW